MHAKTLAVLGIGFGLLTAGCGDDETDDASASGFFITIAGLAFSPLELAVPPGATVTVINRDADAHTVTSQAAAGNFTPGAVSGIAFDTGPFTGRTTFTLPPNAAEGTVIPYYCGTHLGAMVTPTGRIRTAAGAQPVPEPGGGGGGY